MAITKASDLAKLLADGVVGTTEIGDAQITTAKIADSAITGAKLAAGSVTADKVDVQGSDIPYDNTTSGISANTLQEAIDYLNVLSGGGSAGAQATYTRENFTATAGQTIFTTTNGYELGYLQVYMNGVLLATSDFTANDGSTVVLAVGASAGDEISTIALDSFAISEVLRILNISASAPNNSFEVGARGNIHLPSVSYGDNIPVISAGLTGTDAFRHLISAYDPTVNANDTIVAEVVGRSASTSNAAYWGYQDSGTAGSSQNRGTLGIWGKDHILTWDGNGAVKMQYQPYFWARFSMTTSGGSWQKITGSVAVQNPNSAWSTSTNRFTAPASGRYIFMAGGYSTTSGTNERYAIGVYVNGTLQQFCGGNLSGSDTPLSGAGFIIPMSAGDYAELYMYTAVSMTMSQTGNHSLFLTGQLLG